MIGASDPASFGAMSDFVVVMVEDVKEGCNDIKKMQQSAAEEV